MSMENSLSCGIGSMLGSSHLDFSHFSCSVGDLVEESFISLAFSSLNLSFITLIIVWYPSNWKSINGKGEWGLTPEQGGSEASLTDDNGLQHLYLDILDRIEVQCLQLQTLTYHVVASYWLDPSFSDHPSLSHENSKTWTRKVGSNLPSMTCEIYGTPVWTKKKKKENFTLHLFQRLGISFQTVYHPE